MISRYLSYSLSLGGSMVPFSGAFNGEVVQNSAKANAELSGGFYCDFGAGLRCKRLNVGLGLQYQEFAWNINYFDPLYSYIEGDVASMKFVSFYVKLGVCF